MKVKIELDLSPEEAKELFVPSDKQSEFMRVTYDAYVRAVQSTLFDHIDPYNFTGMNRKNDKQ